MKYGQFFTLVVSLTCLFVSCKKDDDGNKIPNKNTWHVTPNDNLGTEVYRLKTLGLRTNIQQVLEAKSEDNTAGGLSGISSSMTLYFTTIGPPPTGTYKVTSLDKLKNTDQVAIYVQTYGDPRTGGNITGWLSQEGSTQTISYKFQDGKASATFKDIVIKQGGSGATTGTVSANISQ